MKQKIVMKVQVRSDKCRNKALKIAAVANGVSSVSIEGSDRDQLAVTGEGIDSACLTLALRKKFGHANIVSVEEVKDKKKEEPEIKPLLYWNYPYPPCPPNMVCEYQNDSSCIVM